MLAAVVPLCACRKEPARDSAQGDRQPVAGSAEVVAPPQPPTIAWFRGLLGNEPPRVPFFLGIPTNGGECVILNGEERIIEPCTWEHDRLDLRFSQFASSLQAERDPSGSLVGRWMPSKQIADIPTAFVASPIQSPDPRQRFPSDAEFADQLSGSGSQPAMFEGTWRLQFKEVGLAKGTLAQTADGVVTGTVIPTNIGDIGYLAGNVRGRTLWLSRFNGTQAYLIRAEQTSAGHLAGTWLFLHRLTDTFSGDRVEHVDVRQLETIRMKPGSVRPTVSQLDDPAFRGKPVIVDYTGSWCPACIDELPFLVSLYSRFHSQGLEILTVALEGTSDDAANRTQVEFLRQTFGIPWRMDVVSGEFSDIVTQLPPELENADGLPITLFINRDGTVHDVHSGFYGPATGDDYQKLRVRFEDNVRAILASRAAEPPPITRTRDATPQ